MPIAIRLATMVDFPAIDALQKKFNKALSFFPQEQFEGYIKIDGIRVAESGGSIVGYIVSRDRYLKRDELGVIYQLCVAPGAHRQLIGAALVREAFEKSAYGCKLYCLWCAQDLEANYFWEAMGFVPIAFRAGSEKKRRVHIFWEKRIREGDTTTPWWFPAKTEGGAMRADRLVFPIPPGQRWNDELPIVLPGEPSPLPSPGGPGEGVRGARATKEHGRGARATKFQKGLPAPAVPTLGRLQFSTPVVQKPKREKRAPVKACPERSRRIDPKYIAAARELRDRYLEKVNSEGMLLQAHAKYEVRKQIEAPTPAKRVGLLEAA
jgi:ribosomal protein S18 acetylase RimI-like enzyme